MYTTSEERVEVLNHEGQKYVEKTRGILEKVCNFILVRVWTEFFDSEFDNHDGGNARLGESKFEVRHQMLILTTSLQDVVEQLLQCIHGVCL